MKALASVFEKRRDRSLSFTRWSQASVPQNDNRGPMVELEAQIDAKHEEISRLMYARNARPEDTSLKVRLDDAFKQLRAMQEEHAAQLSMRYLQQDGMPSEEDSDEFKKAMELLEHYENSPDDDPGAEDAIRAKP